MNSSFQNELNLNDPEVLSALDDLSIWAAPFGIKMLSVVQYKRNIRALDIGFGSGFPLVELAMRLGSSGSVTGIDPGSAGLERTKFKLKHTGVKNVELVRGAAEHMPFDNDFFDLIVSNNGMNNVQDLSLALGECSRVSRPGAQFVFTFNTDQTFAEFYDVFRHVLREKGMEEFCAAVDEHIYEKRKPVDEFTGLLEQSKFRIKRIYEEEFEFKFSDAAAMLNHMTMKIFMPAWKEVVPAQAREELFRAIEQKLNLQAEQRMGLSMHVPFVVMDCTNAKE